MIFRDSLTLWKPTEVTDPYGNTELQWTEAGKTVYAGVSVQPIQSSEDVGDRPLVVNGRRILTQRGADIPADARDRIILADGLTYELDGDPARFKLDGRHRHTELRVTRTVG